MLKVKTMARPNLEKTFFRGDCFAVLSSSDLHFLWRFLHLFGRSFAAWQNFLPKERFAGLQRNHLTRASGES